MPRPLKYLEGRPIRSLDELNDVIAAGGYIIHTLTFQRIHPGWAASWQFRMCADLIRKGLLLRAIPNPDHPDNKEKS